MTTNCAAPNWCSRARARATIEWVLGYDAKDDKFLDANVKYKFGGNANHFIQVGQFKQPGARGRTVLDQEQRLHLQVLDHQQPGHAAPRRRRLQLRRRQLGPDGELLRPRTDPQPRARQRLRPARLLGADQRSRQHLAPRLVLPRQGHRRRPHPPARPSAWPTWRPPASSTPAAAACATADRASNIGAEAMWVTGPFKVQAEYMKTRRRSATAPSTISAATASTSAACGTSPAKPGATSPACRSPTCRTILPPACGSWACATTLDLNDGTCSGAPDRAPIVTACSAARWTAGPRASTGTGAPTSSSC